MGTSLLIDESKIEERLERFRNDLSSLPWPLMVQKHITFGDCFILDESKHFEIKADLAQEFRIHHSEVMIVGSGKLGFSIADGKRYKPFGESSDIDLAIVSGRLFDDVWRDTFDYWVKNGTLGTNDPWFKKMCIQRLDSP